MLAAYTMLWMPRPVTWWMKEEDEDLRRRFGAEAEAYIERTGRVFPTAPERGADGRIASGTQKLMIGTDATEPARRRPEELPPQSLP